MLLLANLCFTNTQYDTDRMTDIQYTWKCTRVESPASIFSFFFLPAKIIITTWK